MREIKRRRFLVELYVDGQLASEMTTDEDSVAYGGAFSAMASGYTETRLYDGDQEIGMDEVEAFIMKLSGGTDPRSEMVDSLRDVGIKSSDETLLIMADYLRDLARRVEMNPVTVYELLVFEHLHEGRCLGVRATGWYTDPDTLESIQEIVQRQLDDNPDAKLEERDGVVVMGDEKWEQAVARCVEQGIIPPEEDA